MTPDPLPASSPSAQGVDARGIDAFLDALEGAGEVDPHSLMVVRHGHVVAAGWWAPHTADRVHLLYSLSKSFTATALGLAVDEGLVGLDDTVLSHFPEFDADVADPRSRSMRVRHVAAMASGHRDDTWERAVALDPDEPVRGFLRIPPDREPGTVFAYNQPCTYSLATIVRQRSGQTLTAYLRRRLLDPLGIGGVGWQRDAAGRELGFSGLHATTDAIARLGLLYLRGGRWGDRQLLAPGWVAQATQEQIANPDEPFPDWQQGYGFQFWMSRHGYRGDGAYGQFCLVLPEQDAVVAITAATDRMQLVLDAVWEHLLPALGATAPAGPAADAALADRLARLDLPPVPAAPAPPAAAGWRDVTFTPTDEALSEQHSLRAVRVTGDGDGWALTLLEDGWQQRSRLGTDGWAVTEANATGEVPTAVSGGWTDRDTLRADVLFLETPHRLRLSADLPSRTCTATWVTTPLHAESLTQLGAPRPLG